MVALGQPEELKASIGGEVLRIRAKNPETLKEALASKLKIESVFLAGVLQVERPQAHNLVAPILENFPGEVLSLTVGLPTLEDVFIHKTGRMLSE